MYLLGIFLILCIGLFSCSKKEFDAKTYVESFLDAVYHSKYEEYAKALDISEKDAKADIEQDFKQKIQQEFKDFDGIKEEGIEEYEDMMRKVKLLAKYEVVDSKKDDSGDNYIVEVRVEPSDIYQTLEQSSLEVSTKKIEQGMDSEDPGVFASVLTESVQRSIDKNTYGETVTVEVTVTKDESSTYGLEDAEMEKLASALFPQE